MLQEFEWNTLNNILIELYTIKNIKSLSFKIMKILKMLIPYSKGYFIILDDNKNIIKENSYFIGFSENVIDKYINTYYEKDYIKYLYDFSFETNAYKDTNILENNIRKNTDFYINFLKPENIIYGCGIMIIRDNKIIGILNFFRNENLGDFTEKEIYILNILKKHIENMLYNIIKINQILINTDKSIDEFSNKFGLTSREKDILKLIKNGYSNEKISNELSISLSTVKKHIYNLYNKTFVSSRSQLISLFMNEIELK